MSARDGALVTVVEAQPGPYRQQVRAGRHELLADEPESVGGDDAGPGPYDYVLIALGSCTSMTLRMYAERKSIPLERVEVRLSHRKIHARDCADCDSAASRIDEIRREIVLEGDLTDAQRESLLRIADRCPVHRTLTSEVKIRTRLA